jgi:hypothetical protein
MYICMYTNVIYTYKSSATSRKVYTLTKIQCLYMQMNINTYNFMYICIFTYINIHMYTHLSMYIFIYMLIGVDEILALINIAYQGACGGPDPRVPLKK